MKKNKKLKEIILFTIIVGVLAILLVPFKHNTFNDGGTTEYRALLYTLIKWHKIDDDYESGYLIKTEIYWFPNNFHILDYYEEVKPESMYVYKENMQNTAVKANKGSYSLCNTFKEKKKCVTSDSISPTMMNYKKTIVLKPNEKLFYGGFNVTSAKLYTVNNPLEIRKIDFISNVEHEGYIIIPDLSGEYILEFLVNSKRGNAQYLVKLNITK